MARRPPEDPRIADLARYRKAREREKQRAQRPPRPPPPPSQSFLGSNPRAPLILALVVIVLAALWLGPLFF